MCVGMNGDLVAPGERCASTSNRNFVGRQGRGARTHLVSPAMAAAAAVTGQLTDVRDAAGGLSAEVRPPRCAVAAAMDMPNVDTDQIIPARFLWRPRSDGYGELLFNDIRTNEDGTQKPDFVLNRPENEGAQVAGRRPQLRLRLVARARGLGAARRRHPRGDRAELRRHLLQQRLKNGLLPIVLPERRCARCAPR